MSLANQLEGILRRIERQDEEMARFRADVTNQLELMQQGNQEMAATVRTLAAQLQPREAANRELGQGQENRPGEALLVLPNDGLPPGLVMPSLVPVDNVWMEGEWFPCPVRRCGYYFPSLAELNEHFSHDENVFAHSYHCRLCRPCAELEDGEEQMSCDVYWLSQHRSLVHQTGLFQCPEDGCNETRPTRLQALMHRACHAEVNNCLICQRSFNCKYAKNIPRSHQTHLLGCANLPGWECTYETGPGSTCGAGFITLHKARKHLKEVHRSGRRDWLKPIGLAGPDKSTTF